MGHNNPGKMFYRVGEVGQLVGVESYVLRYWEKMFPQLKPEKDESGQRVYTRSDIDLVLRIKNLLYEERYTIDGARKRLKEEGKSKGIKDTQGLLAILRNVRSILQEVSAILEKE
jgi:DNA-binding transcriptional MerR regulator